MTDRQAPAALADPLPAPRSIQAHALDHLRYIRQTMERASSFTAISGWGQVVVGLIGLVAAMVAARQSSPMAGVAVWMAAAVLGASVAGAAMWRKSRRVGVPLLSGPGRKFAFGFLPPLAAGGVLTVGMCRAGLFDWLPGTWLLLFGTAVVAGGATSVKVVPVMGGCLMALGVCALFGPPAWGVWLMAAGFGMLHIGFGLVVAVKYGG